MEFLDSALAEMAPVILVTYVTIVAVPAAIAMLARKGDRFDLFCDLMRALGVPAAVLATFLLGLAVFQSADAKATEVADGTVTTACHVTVDEGSDTARLAWSSEGGGSTTLLDADGIPVGADDGRLAEDADGRFETYGGRPRTRGEQTVVDTRTGVVYRLVESRRTRRDGVAIVERTIRPEDEFCGFGLVVDPTRVSERP